MANNPETVYKTNAPDDLPPPYSSVVGNQTQYGFVIPQENVSTAGYPQQPQPAGYPQQPQPVTFTAPGVYPHPPVVAATTTQPLGAAVFPPGAIPVQVLPTELLGDKPVTVTCYNCGKVVTTKVNYATSWQTHVVAGTVCLVTMTCSLCCLGLLPYCFDKFKDAEHFCPSCNTFLGKNNNC